VDHPLPPEGGSNTQATDSKFDLFSRFFTSTVRTSLYILVRIVYSPVHYYGSTDQCCTTMIPVLPVLYYVVLCIPYRYVAALRTYGRGARDHPVHTGSLLYSTTGMYSRTGTVLYR
jgi:hypothetical protein